MLSPQTGRPYYLLALAAIRFFVVGREKRIGAWLLLPFFAVLPLLFFLVEARVWHPLFFIATGLCGVVLGRIEGWRRWVSVCVYWCRKRCGRLSVPISMRPNGRPVCGYGSMENQTGSYSIANPSLPITPD